MDEIRQVFEGSCALIPIKVVANECKKMADDFIPELVEALASQMNPQVRIICVNLKIIFNFRTLGRLLDCRTLQQRRN